LRAGLPDDFKLLWRDVQLSRAFNRVTGSTYYSPTTIRQMPLDEYEYMELIAQWQK
jgi:hypothetical protein